MEGDTDFLGVWGHFPGTLYCGLIISTTKTQNDKKDRQSNKSDKISSCTFNIGKCTPLSCNWHVINDEFLCLSELTTLSLHGTTTIHTVHLYCGLVHYCTIKTSYKARIYIHICTLCNNPWNLIYAAHFIIKGGNLRTFFSKCFYKHPGPSHTGPVPNL